MQACINLTEPHSNEIGIRPRRLEKLIAEHAIRACDIRRVRALSNDVATELLQQRSAGDGGAMLKTLEGFSKEPR